MKILITAMIIISIVAGWMTGYMAGVKDRINENCEDYQ